MATEPDPGAIDPVPADAEAPRAPPWPRWQRFGFRYLLCHWALYSLPGPLLLLLSFCIAALHALAEPFGLDIRERPWRWPAKCSAGLQDIDGWWQSLTTWLH